MTDQAQSAPAVQKAPVFRGNLVRTVVIGLLIISLLPVLIIGTATYLRSQNTLENQTLTQLTSIAESYSVQLDQLAETRSKALQEINQSSGFDSNLEVILEGIGSSSYYLALSNVTNYINQYINTPTEKIFDQVSIVDSAGTVLVSSDQALVGENLTNDNYLKSLYQTNQSSLSFNPGNFFPDKLVLITTRIYRNPGGAPAVTIVGFSTPSLPASLLDTAQSFFGTAKAYYISSNKSFVVIDPESRQPAINQVSDLQSEIVNSYVTISGSGGNFQYSNEDGQQVFSYIKRIPSVQSTFVLEVPRTSVFGQLQSILPFVLLLLAVIIAATGTFVALSARSIVLPLVSLARNAQTFAAGDWSIRAKVNRRDEIGQLAYSFNSMVEQLSGYYRSLETQVEEKTKRLTLVSEIAQKAIGAPSRVEIFENTVQLIIDRFGFLFAGIYLVDTAGNFASLSSAASKDKSAKLPERGIQIAAGEDSLIGWTITNSQPRLTEDIKEEKTLVNTIGLLPNVRSEATIPIYVADELIAILDLQSEKISSFDSETISLFSTLLDQIATGLRNIQVLESAQVNLRETTTLYRSSRQITQAKTEDEVKSYLTELFRQTNLVSIFFKCTNDQIQLINLTDPSGTRLDESLAGFNIPFAKGLARLKTGTVSILEDLKNQTDFSNLSAFFERRNCKSVAILPIVVGEELKYLLAIGSKGTEPLSLIQMTPYVNLSEVIGTTLERVTLLNQLNQRVSELSTLTTIGQVASSATDLSELFENLFNEIRTSIGEDIGFAVAINDQETKTISIPFFVDGEKVEIESYSYTNDLISQTITSGQQVLHRDASAIGLLAVDSPAQRMTTRSFLGIPLVISDKVIGCMVLLDGKTANRFDESAQGLLTTLAPQISTSIRNAELLNSQQVALGAYDQERFLLNSLLENVPDQITFKDVDGKFIRVSKSYAESLNIEDPTELIDKTDPIQPSQESESEFGSNDERILTTGEPSVGEIEENKSEDGVTKWSLISRIPLLNQAGAIVALLKISRDVTDLVSTQQIAERRANQLLTAAEIIHETTTGSQQIEDTLKRMVDLVKTRFGFYHSSVFILDSLNQFAVLRESTGEAGAMLKQSKHKLAVGSSSIVGQATGTGTPVIINDVTKEQNYYPNPLLPDTRAELAIPLKIGSDIIGALDVQSELVNAFSAEDVNILQVMADQLAVSIQNSNLFTKTQQTLERHRLIQQITSVAGQSITTEDSIRNAVQTLHLAMPNEQVTFLAPGPDQNLRVRASSGYASPDIASMLINMNTSIPGKVAKDRKTVRVHSMPDEKAGKPISITTQSSLSVPVTYSSRLLGVLNVESNTAGAFDENDEEIVTTLANNLAFIISNIELVDQVRLQVDRQRQLFEITSKIRRSVDVETIMQTSVTEICNALNIHRASIHLETKPISTEPEVIVEVAKETNK